MEEPAGRRPDGVGREAWTHQRARAALVAWLATPEKSRPKELPDLDTFCREFHVTLAEAVGFTVEPGFMDLVIADTSHWKSRNHEVMAAIKRNAEDRERKDQERWVLIWMTVIKHPAAEALQELIGAAE